jgi:type IV secretion system protein VirB10
MSDKKETTEEQPNETSPGHRKYVRIFTSVLVCAIALSFIVLAFKSGPERSSKKKTEERNVAPAYNNMSIDEFNRRVEQEVKRRQQMQTAMDPEEKKGQASGQRVQDSAAAADGVTIEEQFADQERQRALRSRVSQAKWLRSGMSQTGQRRPAHDGLEADRQNAKRKKIETEQQQLEQMMATLEGELQSPEQAAAIRGLLPDKAETAPEADIEVVGRPAGEAAPRPGDRLIPTGTVISCVLDQHTMSDYMGSYRALVTSDVYDVTGNHVIIPKGSKLTGRTVRISNVNEAIQARMGMPATWIVLPDGKRISLEKTKTLDQGGIPAVKDKVNYHLLVQFLGVAAYALISHETSREGSGYANDETFEGEAGEAFRSQFAPLIQKYLALVPTITLTPGTPIKLFIEDDIYAKPWRSIYQTFVSKGGLTQ